MNRPLLLALVAALSCVASPTLLAQPLWLPAHVDGLSVEALRPVFEQEENLTPLNGALVLTGRFSTGGGLQFVGELPMARFSLDSDIAESSRSAIGNPYVGVVTRPQQIFGELGVRIPVAQEDDFLALTTGLIADYDRLEAFVPDVISVLGAGNYVVEDLSGFRVRIRAGSALWIFTDDEADDPEAFGLYSVQGWYAAEQLALGLGVSGRILLTESGLTFEERANHQIGATAVAHFGTLQPGLHLRVPLDNDLRETFDFVFGLNLTVEV